MVRGEVGRKGEDVRADTFVALEPRTSGGIDLQLTSRVEPYYGEAIRAQVQDTLARLGVRDALVEIHDYGALPFVIDARVEAAAHRAGVGKGAEARPQRTVEPGAPTARDRLRRSRLYLPGNEPKYMQSAGLYGADGCILDLEDSVHPLAKDAARLLVRNALRCLDFGGAERMVRINPLPLGREDLEAIVPESPEVILIPKAETPEQVREVDDIVSRVQQSDRNLWLLPILESALGIENALLVAQASPRVVALTIGLEDYSADLGVPKTAEGHESLWARSRLVNAAHAARVQAIDSVFSDVDDSEGLLSWGRRSRALGFEGMGCIHPRQIAVIHEAFAPTPQEIDKAQRIVAAFNQAEQQGLGVVSLGSKMIDPPVVERARRLMAQAEAMGLCRGE